MCADPDDLAIVMRLVPVLALAALTGCAAPGGIVAPVAGPAGPRQAILYRDTVTVQFSDFTLCVAPRPAGAQSWSGTLAGCPHTQPYSVTLHDGPVAPRRVLMRLADGAGVRVLVLEDAVFGLAGPRAGT